MIKAIGLIRVSTEEQSSAKHAGVPAQRHAIETIAQQRGIELVKTFEITDVSGSRLLASPEFQEFLRHLEESSIRAVVTKEFSRLMRPENFSDYMILQCFVDNSITLHLPDGPIDFSKKFDKFMATIKAGMAGMELEELRRRMNDAKEEMRRQGKHPGGSHTLARSHRGSLFGSSQPPAHRSAAGASRSGASLRGAGSGGARRRRRGESERARRQGIPTSRGRRTSQPLSSGIKMARCHCQSGQMPVVFTFQILHLRHRAFITCGFPGR